LRALADAQTVVEKHGERYYLSELHRLRGELHLSGTDGETELATRPKRVFSKVSILLENSRRNRGSCVHQPFLQGCDNNKASARKPVIFSRRFMNGSPKALTRRILKKRKRCSTS
jgi:hypothetical protein